MFEDFWSKNKSVIQLVGILTGVGALFLSITPPENAAARIALANIQVVWLVVITICCTVLFMVLHKFFWNFEEGIREKIGIDMKETFSLVTLLALVYLVINLWKYISNIYSDPFWSFISSLNLGIVATVSAIFFHFFWKIVGKIEKYHWKIMFVTLAYIVFSTGGSFSILALSYQGFSFPFWLWALSSAAMFVMLWVMTLYNESRKK